jgi:hypothetical protein
MDKDFSFNFLKFTPLPKTLNPQVLYQWRAPLRAYKKRSKNVLRFYIAVALLLTILVFFLGDRVLMVPIWAVLFLFYLLTITPPPIIENKITKFGIETASITLRWDILSHFYFTKRFGFSILTIVTEAPYYMHTYLIIPDEKIKKDVTRILAEHIMFQEVPKLGLMEKMINALSYLIPDDEDEESVPVTVNLPKKNSQIEQVKENLASFFQKQKGSSQEYQFFDPTSKHPHL